MLIACHLFDQNGVGGHICNENGGFSVQLGQITGYLPPAPGKITVTPTCAEQLFPAMPGIE